MEINSSSVGLLLNHSYVQFEIEDSSQTLGPLIFVGMLSTFGVPGNILILIIFKTKHKPSVYRTIIIAMAIYDLLICVITLPFEFYDLLNHSTFKEKWICKIFRTLNYFFVFNSSSIIQLMTVERYRRVCRPLKTQMSQKAVVICIVVIFFVSVIFTLPNLYIRGIHLTDLENNRTGEDCSVSDNVINSSLPLIFNSVIFLICLCNVSLIIFQYIFIGRAIYQHMKFVKKFKLKTENNGTDYKKRVASISYSVSMDRVRGNNRSEITDFQTPKMDEQDNVQNMSVKRKINLTGASSLKCTKIAVMVSLFFILSYMPTLGEGIIEGIYRKSLDDKPSESAILIIEKTFAINHMINPLIYGFIDSSFRKYCREILMSGCGLFSHR